MSRNPTPASAAVGPDWTDISHYCKELHRIHNVDVRFELRSGPGCFIGAVQVRLVAVAPHLTDPGRTWHYTLDQGFPSHRYKTLEAVCFELCYRIDGVCARELWYQEQFA